MTATTMTMIMVVVVLWMGVTDPISVLLQVRFNDNKIFQENIINLFINT